MSTRFVMIALLSFPVVLLVSSWASAGPNCDDDYVPLPDVAYEVQKVQVQGCLSQGLQLSPASTTSGPRVRFEINGCDEEEQILLKIDLDDGQGLRSVEDGETITVFYSTAGTRSISATATILDDTSDPLEPKAKTYDRTASFEVTGQTYRKPDETLEVSAVYDGQTYWGDAYIYRSRSDGLMVNPVVVTDGFDPGNERGIEGLYDLFNRHNLLEEGLRQGRDFVLLDFREGAGKIQGNAMVLVSLIQTINQMKTGLAPLAVVGPSMGGLISRYALAYMEDQGLDHDTAVYISFDSPHNGANIPLGLQLFVKYFSANSTGAAEGLDALYTPAARQMLLYHVSELPYTRVAPDYPKNHEVLVWPSLDSETTLLIEPRPNADFADFYGDLDAVGFPRRPRLVAIANGSGSGQPQPIASAQRLVNYRYEDFYVDITGRSFAVPDGEQQTTIFRGKINPVGFAMDRLVYNLTQAVGYDAAPGGQAATATEIAAAVPDFGDIISESEAECFIPTTSALALDTTDVYHNIINDSEIMSKTPFDAIYYPLDNEEHVCITAANKEWFFDEVAYVDAYRAALITAILPAG